MSDHLPENYISDENHRITAPTYEALMQVQIVLASAETGQVGPTLLQAGEHFTTEAVPSHAWRPLNRAAGERFDGWIASLPLDGKNIPQELINEAAYTLRPREGDPEFPMNQWWPNVLRLAAKMSDQRRGNAPAVAPGYRPVAPNVPPMPFSAMSSAYPVEAGRAPATQVQPSPNAPRRAMPAKPQAKPMPNANVTGSPGQTAG